MEINCGSKPITTGLERHLFTHSLPLPPIKQILIIILSQPYLGKEMQCQKITYDVPKLNIKVLFTIISWLVLLG